jgi:putative ABC transport system permease protein
VINTFYKTVQNGINSLLLQKLRSTLAALGIFIGTTTVIWLVAMGEGVSYQAEQQILELGANNIIVRSIEPTDGSDSQNANSRIKRYGLLRDDYKRIVSNIPSVERAVPMREVKFELRRENRSVDVKLVGCLEEYLQMNRLGVARGRWLSPNDRGVKRIVLADETARRLFPYENPIGKTVWVGNEFYVVVGQTQARVASAAIGGSLDAREYNLDAYIPLESLRRHIGDQVLRRIPGGNTYEGEIVELSQITVGVKDIQLVDETAVIIETLLEKYHPQEDYAVVVPKELLRQAERTRAMFNVLLVVTASISLLVGGIGIMNIMLATVTERTREIGIRRAIGAKRSDIIRQFLTETLVLTGGGGMLGVLFGLLCGPIYRGLRTAVSAMSPDLLPPIAFTIEPRIAPWSVGLSVFIALGVGLIFGVYPARKAAHLNPIEALRHE